MTETNPPKKINLLGWPFRVRIPQGVTQPSQALLLLHGHLGNENVMWILTDPLPKTHAMLAPRAPVQLGPDQYSWHAIQPQWPALETYRDLGEALLTRVAAWVKTQGVDLTRFDVLGFSQGAVLGLALSLLFPDKIGKVAAIAGFLPQTWQQDLQIDSLSDREFFIAHGTEDEIIPIQKARQAAAWLKGRGAQVTFCEAATGHKLSANCFKGLGAFFR